MLFKDIKQIRGKSEIALHKLRVVLRAVYARKIKHKVRLFAKAVKQVLFGIDIVFKNFFYFNIPRSVLIIADIFQRRAKIFTDKAFSARYKYVHPLLLKIEFKTHCFKLFSVSYHLVRLCYFCQIDISPYAAATERYLQKAHRPH